MSVSDDPNSTNGDVSQLRVVLVDDHPMMRAGVKILLDDEVDICVVAETDNGQAAIRLVREVKPHVIVMDVSLPGVGGAEATRQILAEQPSLRVLALSAHEDIAFARMMLDAGALGYLLKRSAGDEMVRAVRTVALGNKYIDPVLAGAMMPRGPASRRRSESGIPTVSLSEREAEVIRLTAEGHTSKEMASALGLSPRTLETYKARAMAKLNLHTRADLVRYALRSGWLRDP